MVESSRFCVDTSLEAGRAGGSLHDVTLTMFAAIIEWSTERGYTEIVIGADVRFERILKRAGWPMPRSGEPRTIGNTIAVADLLPAGREWFERVRPVQYASLLHRTEAAASWRERADSPAPRASPACPQLQEAPGDQICIALDDASDVMIMLATHGRLFIERLGHGIAAVREMNSAAAEIVIGSVALARQSQADDKQPIISGELPIGGYRFEGFLPPMVSRPTFTIHRPTSRPIPLDDSVASNVMTARQADVIRNAIASRLNIVFSQGTRSGKITLANAVISEIVEAAHEDPHR